MSMIRGFIATLIVLSVLAFQSESHAEALAGKQMGQLVPAEANRTADVNEIHCLASNIYYESANEPEEGKIAVGLVTLNRTGDPRFSRTICGVVGQKLYKKRTHGVSTSRGICQFSWRCVTVRPPSNNDENWHISQRIAWNLLKDPAIFQRAERKYGNILYFHEVQVSPFWANHKRMITKIGHHFFYSDLRKV